MKDTDTWGLEETTTSKLGLAASAERVTSLRVIMEDLVTSHSLPVRGELCLGRSPEVDVRIAMPDVSRRHALLRVGKNITVCDLGSANGTRVRGQRLEPDVWTEVTPGEWFVLGDVIVVVNEGPMQRRCARGVGREAFRGVLEEQVDTFRRHGEGFSVVSARCTTTRRWVDVVEAMLMPYDHLAVISDQHIGLLMRRRSREQASTLKSAIDDHLRRLGVRPELQLASCPEDGATAKELFPDAQSEHPQNPKTLRPRAPLILNEAMQRLYQMVDNVASSPASILILGETGTGKEVLARALHDRSDRRPRPFLALNCAALSENLLESELFGYEKGAFTGAVANKAGLLETAQGGTVFLDELGDMPLSTQAKLLRVLEERKVWRLGGLKPRDIDVRVVAATNRNLDKDIQTGRFRADLFYRLNGLSLTIPPLRERLDEIKPLADQFAKNAAEAMGKPPPRFSLEAHDALERYVWPGNIRELRNVVERAVLLARSGVINAEELPDELLNALAPSFAVPSSLAPPKERGTLDTVELRKIEEEELLELPVTARPQVMRPPPPASSASSGLQEEMENLEKARIVSALEKCHGNQTRAATLLGITRRMLISRIERYGIPRPRVKKDDQV
jgi:two-component system response regulator AtoC